MSTWPAPGDGSPTREGRNADVSYAVDGHCARRPVRWQAAPGSAVAHPLEVQRQHTRSPRRAPCQAPQAESSESEHLRCPARATFERTPPATPELFAHAVDREAVGVDRHPGLAFPPQRYVRVDAAVLQAADPARCTTASASTTQARPQTSPIPSSNPTVDPDSGLWAHLSRDGAGAPHRPSARCSTAGSPRCKSS